VTRHEFVLGLIEKSAAESIDLAADFLIGGFARERQLMKLAVERGKDFASQIPIDQLADEVDEEETSGSEEDEPEKSAGLSDSLLKLAMGLILPATLAAMVAAKQRDGANAVAEVRDGA
jgi:hypothetical protein